MTAHVRSLDGLRFFAFFGVFVFHALQNGSDSVRRVVGYGALGVQVFFVLSGFLIGGGLLELAKARPVPLGRRMRVFYARRALRIFPVYYALLAALLILQWSGQRQVGGSESFWWNATYTTNVKFAVDGSINAGGLSHLWSLSVEEHFYLLAPLLILCCSVRVVSWVCVVGSVVAVAGRAIVEASGNTAATLLSPFQFDCILIGIAAAIVQAKGSFLGIDRRRTGRISMAATAVLVPVLLVRQFDRSAARVLAAASENFALALAVAGLILVLWSSGWPAVAALLSLRPFPYLGKISYAMYLFHLPLLVFASSWFDFLPAGTAIPALAMTVALAALSWHFFEGPINALKRRFPLPAPAITGEP